MLNYLYTKLLNGARKSLLQLYKLLHTSCIQIVDPHSPFEELVILRRNCRKILAHIFCNGAVYKAKGYIIT